MMNIWVTYVLTKIKHVDQQSSTADSVAPVTATTIPATTVPAADDTPTDDCADATVLTHTLAFYGVDVVGNRTDQPLYYTIKLDTVVPTVNFTT